MGCTTGPGYREGLALWQRRGVSPGSREFWLRRRSQTPLLQTGEPRSLVREETTEPCGFVSNFQMVVVVVVVVLIVITINSDNHNNKI